MDAPMNGDGAPGRDPRMPFVVRPEAAREGAPARTPLAALGVVAAAVVVLTGWGLLMPPAPSPPPLEASALPTAPRSGNGSDAPRASRDDDTLLADLAAIAGWGTCPVWRGFGSGAEVGPELVARERARQSVAAGRLDVGDSFGGTVSVWLGDDPDAAAEGLGGTHTVSDGQVAWTVVEVGAEPPVAVRLAASRMADGGVYWQERGRATPAPYCLDDGLAASAGSAEVVAVGPSEDALQRLFAETGMGVCRTWQRMETATYRNGTDVDRAADLAGLAPEGAGWVTLPVQPGYGEPQVRTWVGTDPEAAGVRHGATVVVLQPGDPALAGDPGRAWMAVRLDGRPAAIQLRVVDSPAGRRAWLPTPNAAGVIGDCAPDDALATGGGSPAVSADPREVAGPTVELLRGGDDALAMVAAHFGWLGCRMALTAEEVPPPSAERVDRASLEGAVTTGWLDVPVDGAAAPARVWIGDDLVPLARAMNVAVVAVDGSASAWLADSSRAVEMRPVVTPGGRTFWFQPGSRASPDAPCPGVVAAPETIPGVRSLTCWTDRDRCLEAARGAIDAAEPLFGPGAEVAAGLGEACPPGTRCPWTGPNTLITVTVAPEGWASAADVRAFSAGAQRLALPFRELGRDELGPGGLAMASRPSIVLPVVPPDDPSTVFCPASGVSGPLRGAPWDPRVAWVGQSAVRWPHGFTARFTPTLELVTPFGDVFRAGESLHVAGTVSGEPVLVACQVAAGT